MKTGLEFIQRMQADAEFRQKVEAQPREERLAFLRNEGYDFGPFIQILNNLSSGRRTPGGRAQPGGKGTPGKQTSNFLSRLSQLWFASPSLCPHRQSFIRVRQGG
jgi:hypothetical protein